MLPHYLALVPLLLLASRLAAAEGAPTELAPPGPGWLMPVELAHWTDADRDAQGAAAVRLQAALTLAITERRPVFTVPPGHYRFGSHGGPDQLVVAKAQDLAIEAHGAGFWFHGRKPVDGLVVAESERVVLRGATLDCDPIGFTQAEVIAFDRQARTLRVRLDPGFPEPDGYRFGGSVKALFCAPDGTFRPNRLDWVKAMRPLGGRVYEVEMVHGWIYDYEVPLAVGDRMSIPDRAMRNAITIWRCKGVTVEDVAIHAGSAMAMAELWCDKANTYRRVTVARRPGTRRLLACNADIFHSIKCVEGPVIEACDWGWAGDDIINIHGFFSAVVRCEAPDRLVLAQPYAPELAPGSQISFIDFDGRPRGAATVAAIAEVDDQALLEEARGIPAALRAKGVKVGDFTSNRLFVVRVTLDRPVEAQVHDLATTSERTGNGAVIRRNRFHDSGPASGVHIKGRGARIEENLIERTGGPGILVATSPFFWEGAFSDDLIIARNWLVDCGHVYHTRQWDVGYHGAIAVMTQDRRTCWSKEGQHNRNIRIIDNVVVNPGTAGIFLANCQGGAITGNLLVGVGRTAPIAKAIPAIRESQVGISIEASSGVEVAGNRLAEPGENCRGLLRLGASTPGCGPQVPPSGAP